MNRISEISRNSEVSEKAIEAYLVQRVKSLGGVALKYSNPYEVGYPDRIVILPGKSACWVEVKSSGKKLREIQSIRFDTLTGLGQKVFMVDSRERVEQVIKEITE